MAQNQKALETAWDAMTQPYRGDYDDDEKISCITVDRDDLETAIQAHAAVILEGTEAGKLVNGLRARAAHVRDDLALLKAANADEISIRRREKLAGEIDHASDFITAQASALAEARDRIADLEASKPSNVIRERELRRIAELWRPRAIQAEFLLAWFCDRVRRGEVRSERTFKMFQDHLDETAALPTPQPAQADQESN